MRFHVVYRHPIHGLMHHYTFTRNGASRALQRAQSRGWFTEHGVREETK